MNGVDLPFLLMALWCLFFAFVAEVQRRVIRRLRDEASETDLLLVRVDAFLGRLIAAAEATKGSEGAHDEQCRCDGTHERGGAS